MPSLALGLGLSKNKTAVYSGLKLDAQAVAHYDRVIADGGIIPAGLLGCNAWFVAVKAVYAVTDITTAISAGYDPHYLGTNNPALKGIGTTAGQACSKLYSCSGASGDLTQATAASMPLLLVKNSTDANYWFGSGVAGNYCSTPNAAANQITGDIEIIVNVNYVNNSDYQVWISKDASYNLYIDSSNLLVLNFSSATSSVGIGASYSGWIKATRQASSGDVKFYTSSDGITYTQLGTTRPTAAGNLTNSSNIIYVGSYNSASLPVKGKIYRATISNSIGGTPVVDFNPASYNAATSQTSWVSASGETWTINTGAATTGYKGQIVSFTTLQGDGVDDRMTSGAMTSKSTTTRYLIMNKLSNSAKYFVDGAPTNRQTTYNDGSGVWSFSGATQVAYTNEQALVQLYTSTFNSTSSLTQINNANDTTGTTDNSASTAINIFATNSGSFPSNAIMNSLIETNGGIIDNSTIRTAMYNALKSLYSNAF